VKDLLTLRTVTLDHYVLMSLLKLSLKPAVELRKTLLEQKLAAQEVERKAQAEAEKKAALDAARAAEEEAKRSRAEAAATSAASGAPTATGANAGITAGYADAAPINSDLTVATSVPDARAVPAITSSRVAPSTVDARKPNSAPSQDKAAPRPASNAGNVLPRTNSQNKVTGPGPDAARVVGAQGQGNSARGPGAASRGSSAAAPGAEAVQAPERARTRSPPAERPAGGLSREATVAGGGGGQPVARERRDWSAGEQQGRSRELHGARQQGGQGGYGYAQQQGHRDYNAAGGYDERYAYSDGYDQRGYYDSYGGYGYEGASTGYGTEYGAVYDEYGQAYSRDRGHGPAEYYSGYGARGEGAERGQPGFGAARSTSVEGSRGRSRSPARSGAVPNRPGAVSRTGSTAADGRLVRQGSSGAPSGPAGAESARELGEADETSPQRGPIRGGENYGKGTTAGQYTNYHSAHGGQGGERGEYRGHQPLQQHQQQYGRGYVTGGGGHGGRQDVQGQGGQQGRPAASQGARGGPQGAGLGGPLRTSRS
jgi:hypothetical protein